MVPRSIQWQDQSPSDSQDVRERLDPGKRRCYSPVGVDFDDGRNRGGLSALLSWVRFYAFQVLVAWHIQCFVCFSEIVLSLLTCRQETRSSQRFAWQPVPRVRYKCKPMGVLVGLGSFGLTGPSPRLTVLFWVLGNARFLLMAFLVGFSEIYQSQDQRCTGARGARPVNETLKQANG